MSYTKRAYEDIHELCERLGAGMVLDEVERVAGDRSDVGEDSESWTDCARCGITLDCDSCALRAATEELKEVKSNLKTATELASYRGRLLEEVRAQRGAARAELKRKGSLLKAELVEVKAKLVNTQGALMKANIVENTLRKEMREVKAEPKRKGNVTLGASGEQIAVIEGKLAAQKARADRFEADYFELAKAGGGKKKIKACEKRMREALQTEQAAKRKAWEWQAMARQLLAELEGHSSMVETVRAELGAMLRGGGEER